MFLGLAQNSSWTMNLSIPWRRCNQAQSPVLRLGVSVQVLLWTHSQWIQRIKEERTTGFSLIPFPWERVHLLLKHSLLGLCKHQSGHNRTRWVLSTGLCSRSWQGLEQGTKDQAARRWSIFAPSPHNSCCPRQLDPACLLKGIKYSLDAC